MSVLDKFLDAIKLNDDYDDDFLDENLLDEEDDDFLDDEDDLDEKPKKRFFDRFGKKKSADDDLDDYDLDDEPEREPVQTRSSSVRTAAKAPARQQEKPVRQTQSSKITPMRSSRRTSQAPNMEVCVIKPSSMEDTREIADTLVDNSTVILNLEGIDVELAQRIIDFTSGACYSLGGSLQKVSSYIFVLGPYNVDITGDLQNILGGSAPSVRAGY
ncbi:MAG TPA: cell division protein SepF [Candidatus Blautia faecavium]|uniref:Cell division protein SepF n=1 Tax=Candidatus Blautia faecavium TaxID=2838487 RepID=A0A9D2LV01_9FIRM|nr:cell division protein SepF [Candidatus Blautia faecavium]